MSKSGVREPLSTASVRELRRAGKVDKDGRFLGTWSAAEIPKLKRSKGAETPPRKFTNEFRMGQEVVIIRHEHGWHDGAVGGTITTLQDFYCEVTAPDGVVYEIHKPRDISKVR